MSKGRKKRSAEKRSTQEGTHDVSDMGALLSGIAVDLECYRRITTDFFSSIGSKITPDWLNRKDPDASGALTREMMEQHITKR